MACDHLLEAPLIYWHPHNMGLIEKRDLTQIPSDGPKIIVEPNFLLQPFQSSHLHEKFIWFSDHFSSKKSLKWFVTDFWIFQFVVIFFWEIQKLLSSKNCRLKTLWFLLRESYSWWLISMRWKFFDSSCLEGNEKYHKI